MKKKYTQIIVFQHREKLKRKKTNEKKRHKHTITRLGGQQMERAISYYTHTHKTPNESRERIKKKKLYRHLEILLEGIGNWLKGLKKHSWAVTQHKKKNYWNVKFLKESHNRDGKGLKSTKKKTNHWLSHTYKHTQRIYSYFNYYFFFFCCLLT